MDLIGLLFKTLVVLAVGYGLYTAGKVLQRLNAVFAELAVRYNGRVERRVFFDFPRLILEHRGRSVQLSVALAQGADVLVAKLHVFKQAALPVKLYLLPSNAVERFGAKIGFQDINLGNKAFDQAYIVKAEPVAAAAGFLTPEVQQALLKIRDLSPEIQVAQEYIVLKTNVYNDAAQYDRLLAAAFVLNASN